MKLFKSSKPSNKGSIFGKFYMIPPEKDEKKLAYYTLKLVSSKFSI